MDNLPHEEQLSDEELQKGYTADFIAPLTIKEEVVELYFEDLTKSMVRCTRQGCLISVLFDDKNALQKALGFSSHKIDDQCCLTLLSRAATLHSPVATVGNPTEDSLKLSTEPQFGGLESATRKTAVVFTMNVDCGVHLAQYCLKDLNSYLSIAHCVISSTIVPGDLLLQYDASVTQLNVDQIMDKIYEYATKFTTFVVTFPEHCDEKNLKHLLHSGSTRMSCCFVGHFSGSRLYKICCQTTYVPEVQRLLSGATEVPLFGCIPSADAFGKAGLKRREIATSFSAAADADVKSVPSSSTIAESSTTLVPRDFPVPTRTEPSSNATPGVQTHDTGVTGASGAQITSHSNRVVPKDLDSVDTTSGTASASYSLAVEHKPQKSLAVSSSTVGSSIVSAANDFATTAASYTQPTAALSALSASTDYNVQQTAVSADSVRSAKFSNDHLDAAEDNVSVTVSADSRFVQVFQKDLERHFLKDLEKHITVKEPACHVKLYYDDEGFLFCGNRDGVRKAQELLQVYIKCGSVKERELDTSLRDDSSSSRWIGDVNSERLPFANKPNDAPVPNRMAAYFKSGDMVAAPSNGATAGRIPKEQFKDERSSNFDEETKILIAATRELGSPDEYSRHKILGGITDVTSPSHSLVLELGMGSVAEQTADVLVNSVDHQLILRNGSISSSMLEKGGYDLQQELWRRHPLGIPEFNFAVTKGYKLNCNIVLHVACGYYKERDSEKNFSTVIFECLRYADSCGMKSIVFPAIGAGVLGYPPETVIKLLHSAISSFSAKVPNRKLRSVRCVVYDKRTYDAFESALARLLRDDRGGSDDFGLMASPRESHIGTKQRQEMTHDNQVDEKYVHRHSSESGSLLQSAGVATRPYMESDNQQTRTTNTQRYSSSSYRTASTLYSSGLGAKSEFSASQSVGLPSSDATDRSYLRALSTHARSLPRTQSSSSSRSTSERTYWK